MSSLERKGSSLSALVRYPFLSADSAFRAASSLEDLFGFLQMELWEQEQVRLAESWEI